MSERILTRGEALRLGVACGAIDGGRLLAKDRRLLEQGPQTDHERAELEALKGSPTVQGLRIEVDAANDEGIAVAFAAEAQGVAGHCLRLGHDYEVDDGVVACGRCGAAL